MKAIFSQIKKRCKYLIISYFIAENNIVKYTKKVIF